MQCQFSGWQDKPTSPTKTVSYLCDGAGQRLERRILQGGTTTTNFFVGGERHPAAHDTLIS